MAMSISADNTHYRIAEIQRRHWNAVAKRNALGLDLEQHIERFISATPQALNVIAAQLPRGFPDAVRDPIFEGIKAQVRKLALG